MKTHNQTPVLIQVMYLPVISVHVNELHLRVNTQQLCNKWLVGSIPGVLR